VPRSVEDAFSPPGLSGCQVITSSARASEAWPLLWFGVVGHAAVDERNRAGIGHAHRALQRPHFATFAACFAGCVPELSIVAWAVRRLMAAGLFSSDAVVSQSSHAWVDAGGDLQRDEGGEEHVGSSMSHGIVRSEASETKASSDVVDVSAACRGAAARFRLGDWTVAIGPGESGTLRLDGAVSCIIRYSASSPGTADRTSLLALGLHTSQLEHPRWYFREDTFGVEMALAASAVGYGLGLSVLGTSASLECISLVRLLRELLCRRAGESAADAVLLDDLGEALPLRAILYDYEGWTALPGGAQRQVQSSGRTCSTRSQRRWWRWSERGGSMGDCVRQTCTFSAAADSVHQSVCASPLATWGSSGRLQTTRPTRTRCSGKIGKLL
jgi:hypothetical protein